MGNDELKACLMCGNDSARKLVTAEDLHYFASNYSNFAVVCCIGNKGCGASGGFRQSETDAIAAWNTRAAPSEPEVRQVLDMLHFSQRHYPEANESTNAAIALLEKLSANAKGECKTCDGRGVVASVGYIDAGVPYPEADTCPHCKGSGEAELFDTSGGPDGDTVTGNCSTCKGTGAAHPLPWEKMIDISDIPEVHDALESFSHDSTQDNAVGLISRILSAVKASPTQETPGSVEPYAWVISGANGNVRLWTRNRGEIPEAERARALPLYTTPPPPLSAEGEKV